MEEQFVECTLHKMPAKTTKRTSEMRKLMMITQRGTSKASPTWGRSVRLTFVRHVTFKKIGPLSVSFLIGCFESGSRFYIEIHKSQPSWKGNE